MFRHHRRIVAPIALTLALAAAAPAAARPALESSAGAANPSPPASTNLCSEVCGAGYTGANAGANLARNPTAGSVAHAGAGYGYGSAPTTSTSSNNPRSEVVSGAGYGNPNVRAAMVRVDAPGDGFDWGDASIGAAGALALMTLGIGGALGANSIRRRTTRTPA